MSAEVTEICKTSPCWKLIESWFQMKTTGLPLQWRIRKKNLLGVLLWMYMYFCPFQLCTGIDGPMLLSTLDINLHIQNQAVIIVNFFIPYVYFFTSRIECKRAFCQRDVNSTSKFKKKKKPWIENNLQLKTSRKTAMFGVKTLTFLID